MFAEFKLAQSYEMQVGGDEGLTPESADDAADAEECSEGHLRQEPCVGFASGCGNGEHYEREGRAEQDADGEGK
jgi:hypothetical protein